MKLILSFLCLSVQSAKILHISDIHYDSRYHIGGVEHCYLGSTGLGCCRKNDIPLKPSGYANEWGSYNCDTPIKLLNESLKWISDHIQIDKIIYTGDSVDHHDITQTIGHNLNEIGTVFTLFREYFPDTQLFHILGNHDTYPIDQTPPFIYPKFLSKYVYMNVRSGGNPNQNKTIEYGGYFYDYINGINIKVISLNTMYYDTKNMFKKFDKKEDPMGQWEWLETELIKSVNNNEKVWLLFHIPPGNFGADKIYKTKLIYYLSKYTDTITATFSGHIHSDNFKLYFDKSNLVGFSTIPSSLMPDKINPSFRIIYYDQNNGKLLNYKQYTADLNKTIQNNRIDYVENYDFKELYNVDDISKESFLKIYHNMRMNNTVLNQYYTYNKPDGKTKNCSEDCRNELFNDILIR